LRFFADEGLGSPHAEADNRVGALEKLLRQSLPEEQIPEIKPLILFSHKNVELNVTNPEIPVLRSNELKTYLREQDKNRAISAVQRQQLLELLRGKYQEVKE
jgi:hypothetical protein